MSRSALFDAAPAVSNYVGHAATVTDFPLGSRLGQLWYGIFPIALPVWLVVLTGTALAMVISIVSTFGGIVADPIHARWGIHRRRLIRSLDAIAVVGGKPSGIAPDHIAACLADIPDAGLSLIRFLRS